MKSPPSCNTGGNLPSSVLVDWVSVVFPGEAVGVQGDFLKAVRRLFDGTVTSFVEAGGLHGYRYSCRSPKDEGSVSVAWGGNSGTVLLVLPGDACARVDGWPDFVDFIAERRGHLTRVDLAFDDVAGRHTVDEALALYLEGFFSASKGGAKSGASAVKCSQFGNWARPDGSGRTLYVGKSTNGKMLRCYEKGKQLGDPVSPWVRWEVQFGNRDRTLPLAMLLDPAPYLRGSYPALQFVQGESCRVATRRAQDRISVEKLTRHCREAYGPLVGVLVRSGLEADAVIARVSREGLPRRLNAPTLGELEERCHLLVADAIREEIDCRSEVHP